MSISDFQKNLRSKGHGPGATWLKADFHIHLPSSHDYKYKEPDAYEQLGKALEDARLSFAVVLKHEAFATKAELALLQPHCPSVTLIPGAEINVLVDALSKKIGKDYFFHCIVAVDPTDEDEFGYVLRSARENLQYRDGSYPAGFRSSVVDVAGHFRNSGALFIPAHLHQAKSPEESRSIDDLYDDDSFLGFIRDGAFDALEVRQTSTAGFFDGVQLTADRIRIPRISCVCSSDAHHHAVVGKRATWIRAERPSFGEVKAALALPHRVALTPPEMRHPRVVGLHVVGSFIGDVWLALNESLNALIGGKGSGKTALLECLRFVLNTPVPSERFDEVAKHRHHILGNAGYVECLVQDADGKHWLVARRADSGDRITMTPEHGEIVIRQATAGPVFPISILGWHEIESVADRASARIRILDQAGQPEKVIETYGEIRKHIANARDALPLLQRQVRRLDSGLKELWELRRKRATLTKLTEGRLSQLQEQYEWFLKAEERLQSIVLGTSNRQGQLKDVIPSRIDASIPSPAQETGGTDARTELSRLEERAQELERTETRAMEALEAAIASLGAQATSARTALGKSFQSFRDDVYAPAVALLSTEEREILTRQIQILEETKRLPSVESTCTEQLRELRVLAKQLQQSCESICTLRDRVASRRQNLVDELNKELLGVRLEFRQSANREARDKFQGSYPSDGALLINYVDRFEGREAYEKLTNLFEGLQQLDLDSDKWTIEEHLFDAKFIDLLDVIDDDDVGISLEVGKRGFVEIQNLSAGQRCVAVFPLLLRNSRGPLVIDQPEDNLDNRYIADTIGPDLLKRKLAQQYLVTSHNANLVVLTDADLIVHVDSDGTRAEFPTSGFLAWARSSVKESVLGVLDGGEAALLARQRKYGIQRT